jgi:hypothetical protein
MSDCLIDKMVKQRDAANGVDAGKRKLIEACRLVANHWRKLGLEPVHGCNPDGLDVMADKLERELEAGNEESTD